MRTVCRKCKSICNVIEWSVLGCDYICPKCGYVSREKVERLHNGKESKSLDRPNTKRVTKNK